MAIQNIENQENGGITDLMITEFEDENSEFNDRSRFEVNFEDADNKLSAKRFYITIIIMYLRNKIQHLIMVLSVGHVANLEDKNINSIKLLKIVFSEMHLNLQ